MNIPPSTPIEEAIVVLRLNADERTACLSLIGVRTLGDLLVVLERKEIEDKELAAKLKKVLG